MVLINLLWRRSYYLICCIHYNVCKSSRLSWLEKEYILENGISVSQRFSDSKRCSLEFWHHQPIHLHKCVEMNVCLQMTSSLNVHLDPCIVKAKGTVCESLWMRRMEANTLKLFVCLNFWLVSRKIAPSPHLTLLSLCFYITYLGGS